MYKSARLHFGENALLFAAAVGNRVAEPDELLVAAEAVEGVDRAEPPPILVLSARLQENLLAEAGASKPVACGEGA